MDIKKTLMGFAFLAITNLSAHDFWVDSQNNSDLSFNIGYGHDFPKLEKIPEERLEIFEALKITGEKQTIELKKSSTVNYNYELNQKLEDGSYILSGVYKPTYWTKDENFKWFQGKTKDEIKTKATFCEKAHFEAKNIFSIGNKHSDIITKPIGHKLEIVPLSNPKDYKVGKPFKVKVLFKNRPLKVSAVKATLEGYLKGKFAYYGTTDLRGVTEILPLKAGRWLVKAEVKKELEDKSKCDEEINVATLTFDIKE
ncbi:hypothetical protein CRV01_01485 [Arcobacter sp. CECT 8983]|uniref:DUF4198 domain-containing protein n=1 Tax=Arcobacter sp. CECT 8983 TaxID=2044508 RepID=UPI00100AA922|nr:DUF4198 domain-containing protein [Arcobacter sp. CECT 8983]RXJ91791.1 hypothetical protein CRV01_01485 [Arcobacter sp. CECT 8983]